jgi:hypothetical protein
MALDVFYKQDILNVLRATCVASEGSASLMVEMLGDEDLQGVPVEKLMAIYRRGFQTALASVGLAFGLVPVEREQAAPRVQEQPVARLESAGGAQDLIGFLWTEAKTDRR